MRVALKTVVLVLLVAMRVNVLAVPASELKEAYQPIVDRNPFGLRPPPPPPTNNVAAPVKEKPKTELFLTGITAFGTPRVKKAYLMTKEAAGKKDPVYYTFTEGVEQGGIKVLSIDDLGRKVRVHTEDGEQLLSFQSHGVPPPAATAAKPGMPGQPGQPPQPGQNFPVPQPGAVGQPQPITPGTQPAGTFPTPNVNPGVTGVSTPSTTRQIPSRRVRAGIDNSIPTPNMGVPGANNFGGQAPQADIDPAEQYLRAHLNKAAAEKETGIAFPPVPIIGGQ